MSSTWATTLGMTWQEAAFTVVTAVVVYTTVIVLSRVLGQRQFTVSSSYDLAFIFAMGTLVGRVVLIRTSAANAVLALVTMSVLHDVIGRERLWDASPPDGRQ